MISLGQRMVSTAPKSRLRRQRLAHAAFFRRQARMIPAWGFRLQRISGRMRAAVLV